MNNFLIVSFEKTLEEHAKIAQKYHVAFEINDFYDPDVLDSPERIDEIIARYNQIGVPAGSTMHGAFFDVILHSRDAAVRENARKRMRQSMDIAHRMALKGVVFHTNYQPGVVGEDYVKSVIDRNVEFLGELLEAYPSVNIYLENMFDDTPRVLVEISKRLQVYPNYGVCFDYGHAFVYGTDIRNWVEELAPYTRHLHINDNDLKRDLHLALGAGSIDWEEFNGFYRQYFSRCSVLVEIYGVEQQKESLKFLEGLR